MPTFSELIMRFRIILEHYMCLCVWLCFTSHRHQMVYAIWRLSSLSGGGRHKMPFYAIFQALMGTWVEPTTFRKLAGKLPHMKESEILIGTFRRPTVRRSCLKSTIITTRSWTPHKGLYFTNIYQQLGKLSIFLFCKYNDRCLRESFKTVDILTSN
jgi:hypothetical protein